MVFENGTLAEKIAAKAKRAGIYGIKFSLIEGWIKAEIPSIKESVRALKEKGVLLQFEDVLVHKSAFETYRETVKKIMDDFHKKNPLKPGMLKEELRSKFNVEPRLFGNLLASMKDIIIEKEMVRLAIFRAAFSGVDEALKSKIAGLIEKGGFQPPSKEELSQSLKLDQKHLSDILGLMTKEGSLVRISDSMSITASIYDKMITSLKNFFSKKPEMTVAEFRDVLGTSRKYALPFLEYLDTHKITLRVGDVRKLLLK